MEQTRSGSGGLVLILLVIVALLAVLAGPQIGAALATIPAAGTALTVEQEMTTTLDGFMGIVYDPGYSHAAQEHPGEFEAVRKCIEKNGPYVTFQVVPKQRYLHVCLVAPDVIGFMIVDLVNKAQYEKTAYIKDAMKCINDVFKYARKVGYSRFTGPLP